MENFKLQFLQLELNRVSEWIQFSDKKTAFLFAFYSAILGLIFSQKELILQHFVIYQKWITCFSILILIGLIISFLVGIFFLLKSVFPKLKNSFTNKSLFYFGHVASMKFIDYSEQVKKLTDDEAKKQIIEQIFTNSIIADQKMKYVQKSIKSFIVLVFFAILLLVFI